MKKLCVAVLLLLVVTGSAWADVLFGECYPRNGARISTSWNGRVAYSSDGKYRLEFDGRVNSTITVYVNGNRYAQVKVDGATRLDIDTRKK